MIGRLFPFLVMLLAVGLFMGYINPTYTGSVATVRAEIASYDHALVAAEQFKEKQSELTALRNNIPQAGIERLESFLPDGVDNVQLILDLDALATRSGVKLANFQMEDPNKAAGGSTGTISLEPSMPVESLTLGVSAAGTYEALHRFLAGVEQSLRPLDLVSFTLVDSETGVYTYQMLFTMYWLR